MSKSDTSTEFLYLEIYHHYKKLIMDRKLLPGTRMPSLRKCAALHQISRTTAENAYLQLAAEGYVIAKAQSGYYVTNIADRNDKVHIPHNESPIRYDFASRGADRASFRFDIWRRYLRSALRQDHRMLSYPQAQGEPDLRQALSDYMRRHRNILCFPEEIVIGAGTQSLLQLLCPIFKKNCSSVSFPTPDFIQGAAVFQDYGFQINYRDKNSDIIYVSPAQMTKWGEVMPVTRRLELIEHAQTEGHYVIEDDYGNEFIYLPQPLPSIYGLGNQMNTIYLGSFSRLLLPSIRLSFMILPPILLNRYMEKTALYNQTASKAEQIALAQYLRDGHLENQIRKQKRLYAGKRRKLIQCLQKEFGISTTESEESFPILCGPAGTTVALCLPPSFDAPALLKSAIKEGLRLELSEYARGRMALLLSCSSMPDTDFEPACGLLRKLISEAV